MKKLYTFILLCSLVNIGNAQITLTKAFNEPVVGDAERKKGFDTTSAMPINTGLNQVWNFTSLTTNTSLVVSTSYTTPSSLTGSSSYPAATIGSTDGGTNNNFYKATSTPTTQYEALGIKANTLTITFTNSAVMAVWPITMGYSNTDAIGGSISASTLSGTFNGNVVTNATGTGTVMLPGGVTFTNCLQVKSKQTLNASFLFGLVTLTVGITSYEYYHSSQKFPILTHNVTSITSATATLNSTVTAVSINNDVFTGIKENSNSISSLNIYPNPATNQFAVSLNNQNAETVSVQIMNSLGQVVKTVDLGNTKGELNTSVDVRNLSAGLYHVKTTMGNSTSVKELIIQ